MFDKDLTIYAPEGSTAQTYARVNGIAFAATVASAVPNASAVYVNGKLVSVEAYTIGGSNYFKLRDLGSALHFNVTWDGSANAVRFDTSAAYTS